MRCIRTAGVFLLHSHKYIPYVFFVAAVLCCFIVSRVSHGFEIAKLAGNASGERRFCNSIQPASREEGGINAG